MKQAKYILLGSLLTIVALGASACFKSVNKTETREGVVFQEDIVFPIGGVPQPVSEVEAGTYSVNDIVPAGTPIDPEVLFAAYDADKSGNLDDSEVEVANTLPTFEQVEYEVEIDPNDQVGQTIQGIAVLSSAVGGPWGAAAALLLTQGWTLYRGFQKQKSLIEAETGWDEEYKQNERNKLVIDSTFRAINDIRSSARLMPDEKVAENVENGITNLLRAAHKSVDVIDDVKEHLKTIDSPYITSLSADNANGEN